MADTCQMHYANHRNDEQAFKYGPSDATDEEVECEPSARGYIHTVSCCEDGDRWKITKALSPIKYQQSQPPFEASQVFSAFV